MKKFNLFKMLAVLIVLITSINTAWGWSKVSLRGSMKGIGWDPGYAWNSESGEESTETYAANGDQFKLYIHAGVNEYVGYCYSGPDSKSSISSDGTASHLYKEYGGHQDQNVEYSGCNGIVCFHYKNKDQNDHPWVWITRPTVYLKNTWNSSPATWTWKSTEDEGNGYYYVDAKYGASGVNWGTNGTSAWQKNSSDVYISCTPSPSTLEAGRKCRYRLNTNPSGSSWDAATPTLTITGIYTVTFNMKGHGDAVATQEILYGSTASTPDAPSATGYTFGGWYTDEGCTIAFNWSTTITADRVLYAKWTEKSYSITFTNDGHGSVAVGGVTVSSGNTAMVNHFTTKTLVATNNTGYHFSSWTKSGSNTDKVTIASTSSYSTTIKATATGATVRANFAPDTYTAANNIKNTSGTGVGQYTATYDATTIAYNTKPTKSGYHIAGLYKEVGLSNKIVDGETALCASTDYTTAANKWNQTASRDLYVEWEPTEYTISFDGNKGSRVGTPSNIQANVTVTFDNNNFSDDEIDIPVLDGYTFGGYYTDAAFSEYQLVDADGHWTNTKTGYLDGSGNWIYAGNKTLYAKWTANTYKVTLNATQNGGTCSVPYITATMGAKYGESVDNNGDPLEGDKLPTPPDPSGYRFIGWYDAADGGTKVEDNTIVATDHDHTLYAHFSEITYVYFYNNIDGWGETVYVIFNANWVDKRGTGRNGGRSFDTMERIGTSNIYRKEVPRYALEENWQYNIAFCNTTDEDLVDARYVLKSGKAIYRTDFDSYATMFVPNSGDTFNPEWESSVTYYSTSQWDKDWSQGRHKAGYWMKYNPYVSGEAGYVVKGTWDGENNDFFFRKTKEGNSYTFTKYLPAGQTYNFRIYKHCKTNNTHTSWFIGNSSATITSSITNWTLSTAIMQSETSRYDHITTSIAGDYEFKITCNTNGTLTFDVTYPGFAVDDNWYRLLYEWNDGSAHSRVCETFQRIANGGTEWIDAFIHKASNVTSQSLKLQKYVTVSSTPTWSNVQTITLPSDKITRNGVYTFRVDRPSASEASGSFVAPYEEDFYLRSDITAGGWDYYTDIAFGGTQNMTYSDYSARQTTDPYSYYYCKYVDNAKQNVAFTIATLNTPSICDTLVGDAIIGASPDIAGTIYKHLPSENPANIRFMYNDSTNAVKRAYLKSAQGSGRNRFLVLHGNTKVFNTDESAVRPDTLGLENDEFIFIDRGNWVYELSLKASPVAKAKIIAQYNGSDRYLIGGSGDTSADWKTILGAPADDLSHKYALAGTYDFKTNRLMVAWTPDGTDITAKLSDIDMLWVRVGDAAATQINFGEGGSLEKISAVGAIKINWSDVNGRVGDWNNGYTRRYAKYFVSFPFDVKVSDIFGLNKAVMGREYIIQKYNGAKRAKDGLFLGDDATFWETLTADSTMHANEGYLVMFDNDYLNSDSWSIWDNNKGAGKAIYLYFPADKQISAISNSETTTTVYPHQSTRKEKWTDASGEHEMKNTDSHWNLIGGPFFHNATISSSTPGGDLSALHSYYRPKTDNTWEACVLAAPKVADTDVINNAFKAMSCIMVQWYGTLTWNTTTTTPAFVAARHTEEQKDYLIQLDLTRGEEYSDHAFVDLREGANSEFVLCEDMMKIVRNGKPNVYVYAGAYDVAYSQVPEESQTIPVGVIIPQNGTYTFTMPTNFSGTVTLIDKFAQTRTNLGLGDYEIYLNRGTINDRFELEININKMPTAIDGVEGGSLKDGKAHKFIENGVMYILRDGKVFDAQGRQVK